MHRRIILIVFLQILLLTQTLTIPSVFSDSSTSLEETISRRRSTHKSGQFTAENITQQELLKVLWAAYGYIPSGLRTVPSIDGSYPLIIYSVNSSGSYRYIPESNSLILHDQNITKKTIEPYDQVWPSEASAVIIIVWNKTKTDNQYFAAADAGSCVQNIYLEACAQGLGTCCVGAIDINGLRDALKLSTDLEPLLVMPLGYPKKITLEGFPKWDSMTGNLPKVKYSNMSLLEAIEKRESVTQWSQENLSPQEYSQLLWAAYGYTNITLIRYGENITEIHRTVPSAINKYSMEIFLSNATGIYEYVPGTHSLTKTLDGDKRFQIAYACGEQNWAANSPAIFIVAFNDTKYPSGRKTWIEIEAGCMIQNLFLESSAWNLGTNVIGNGLEDWNGTGAEKLRNILDLTSNIIPLYIMPIGHKVSAVGYELNLHIFDWDMTDSIGGVYVYKDYEVKISDTNGWANWTRVQGTVQVKVKYFGRWVNDTFTVLVDRNKTIEVQCKIFDIEVTCLEDMHGSFLQNANVTAFNSTSTSGNRIYTGRTDAQGKVELINIPNGTITVTVYDGQDNLVIANATRTIISEEQQEIVTCNQNYVNAEIEWRISQILVEKSFLFAFSSVLLVMIAGLVWKVKCFKNLK